eukprot:gene24988-28249_t
MTDRYCPRTCDGNISAPMENTIGTEPPIPNPPMTLHAINTSTFGAAADASPASRLRPSEYSKHGLRPTTSEAY